MTKLPTRLPTRAALLTSTMTTLPSVLPTGNLTDPAAQTSTAMTALPAALPPGRLDASDRTAWVSMVASARLPTGQFDMKRANELFDTVLIPRVHNWSDKEDMRRRVATYLRNLLRAGQLPFVLQTVRFANAGDEICDAELRAVGAELQMPLLQRQELAPGHLQIIAYCQEVLAEQRPPRRRPGPGRHDNWMRDIQIWLLIVLVHRDFGLPVSRNRRVHRDDDAPSAVSFVVDGLKRNGLATPSEQSVQENVWFGFIGEVMHEVLRDVEEAARFPQARSTILGENSTA